MSGFLISIKTDAESQCRSEVDILSIKAGLSYEFRSFKGTFELFFLLRGLITKQTTLMLVFGNGVHAT